MKFKNTEVFNFEGAFRGLRNPMNSWDKADSIFHYVKYVENAYSDINAESVDCCKLGENDLKLAQGLIKAGSEHRKFMRQIFCSVDITAPAYFMAELDTYKIGVTRNSSSFQHKGTSKRFEIDDFELDDEIKEVLRIKTKDFPDLFYSYETNEFKIYTAENGRQYKVYKNGRVFSLPFSYTDTKGRVRDFPEKECVPSKTKSGYFELNIGGRNSEKWLLHRLIAEVWLDNPNNFRTVDHKDGNKANNCVENLEWVTLEENIKREWNKFEGFDLQKKYKSWKISSKINPADRLKIRELYSKGYTQKKLSEMFEVGQAQISVICRDSNSTSENRELFEHCWYWEQVLEMLNILRDKYLETKDYKYFRLIRQLLPQSYLYHSTITMSYENIYAMIRQRKNHKLSEWSKSFIEWAESLPYAKELLFI